MTVKVKSGGAVQTASAISIKIAGVMRAVRTIRVMHGAALRTVYSTTSALTASASPASVFGVTASTPCVTDSTTMTPSGGTSPYTYSWALVSFSGGNTPTVTSSTLASTTFQQAKLGGADESNTAIFRCTVTDSLGATATADVSASFEFLTGA